MEPRTSDPDYDYILQKSGPSIFFQTPVTAFLTKHGVDTTIVVGCMTSGCIRASVIDSFSYGYRTMVPEDCVGDADERPHRDNLRDVGRRYADIVSSERVLDYLDEIRKRNACGMSESVVDGLAIGRDRGSLRERQRASRRA